MQLPPCVKELQMWSSAGWLVSGREIQLPLSRQFHVLETLNIRGWSAACILDLILCSCPHLRVFCCYIMRLEELEIKSTETSILEGDDHDGVGPFGWVCRGLEKLGVEFVFGTEETRRLLFDQLCCMKELTSVAMGGLNPAEIQWYEGEVPRTWKDQTIGKDEITSIPWMRDMWSRLESFRTYDEALSDFDPGDLDTAWTSDGRPSWLVI